MERFKIAIVVPAFNEEKTISDVIKDLKNYSEIILWMIIALTKHLN